MEKVADDGGITMRMTVEEARDICKLGEGSECCSFLIGGDKGFECAFGQHAYRKQILKKLSNGEMTAVGTGYRKNEKCPWHTADIFKNASNQEMEQLAIGTIKEQIRFMRAEARENNQPLPPKVDAISNLLPYIGQINDIGIREPFYMICHTALLDNGMLRKLASIMNFALVKIVSEVTGVDMRRFTEKVEEEDKDPLTGIVENGKKLRVSELFAEEAADGNQ